jgi:hypothetical protein
MAPRFCLADLLVQPVSSKHCAHAPQHTISSRSVAVCFSVNHAHDSVIQYESTLSRRSETRMGKITLEVRKFVAHCFSSHGTGETENQLRIKTDYLRYSTRVDAVSAFSLVCSPRLSA